MAFRVSKRLTISPGVRLNRFSHFAPEHLPHPARSTQGVKLHGLFGCHSNLHMYAGLAHAISRSGPGTTADITPDLGDQQGLA